MLKSSRQIRWEAWKAVAKRACCSVGIKHGLIVFNNDSHYRTNERTVCYANKRLVLVRDRVGYCWRSFTGHSQAAPAIFSPAVSHNISPIITRYCFTLFCINNSDAIKASGLCSLREWNRGGRVIQFLLIAPSYTVRGCIRHECIVAYLIMSCDFISFQSLVFMTRQIREINQLALRLMLAALQGFWQTIVGWF